jgi:tetratricopeptide (TPR) repeat protein
MKRNICIILLSWLWFIGHARCQTRIIDSLKQLIQTEKRDSTRSLLYQRLSFEYAFYKSDSALLLAEQGLELAREINFPKGEVAGLGSTGIMYSVMGDDAKALELLLQALKISEATNEKVSARVLGFISQVYDNQGEVRKAMEYSIKERAVAATAKDEYHNILSLLQISGSYIELNQLDSAFYFAELGYDQAKRFSIRNLAGAALSDLGKIYAEKKQYPLAMEKYEMSLSYKIKSNGESNISSTYLDMAEIFSHQGLDDSCLYYAKISYTIAQKSGLAGEAMEASRFLADFYKKKHAIDSAYFYLSAVVSAKDSIFSQEKTKKIQSLSFNETVRQQDLMEQKKLAEESRVNNLQLLAIGVFIPIFFLVILFLGRIKVKPRLVEFLGVLGLLLFFEFITDLAFPFISKLTNDRPLGEMLILVAIAASLEPLNYKMENWIKMHLVR